MPKKLREKLKGVDLAASTDSLGSFYSADDSVSVASDWSSDVSSLVNSISLSPSNSKLSKATPLANEAVLTDTIVSALDMLLEKRASKRMEGLKKLESLFSLKFVGELLETRTETLIAALARCLSRKDDDETVLASHVAALLYAQLGPSEELYRQISKLLLDSLKAQSDEKPIGCASIVSAMAIVGSMENMDPFETSQLIAKFSELIETETLRMTSLEVPLELSLLASLEGSVSSATSNKSVCPPSKDILVAALKALGLVLGEQIDLGLGLNVDELVRLLDRHFALLYSDNLPIRVAAGHNIALIASYFFPAKPGGGEQSDETTESADDGTSESFSSSDEERVDNNSFSGSLKGTEPSAGAAVKYHANSALLQKLQALSVESNKRTNKKDKQRQKSVFREIYKTVHSGILPSVKLKLRSETIYFDSWIKIKQLNALRELFGEGLSVHLTENPHVRSWLKLSASLLKSQDILDGDGPSSSSQMSDFEKRQFNQVKNRERQRRGNQGRKTKMSEMFLLSNDQ